MDTTVRLSADAQAIAPDGMEVRLLATTARGSMAHFRLGPGAIGGAVRHRTVEELWFCLAGLGEMWVSAVGDRAEAPMPISAGVSFSIPTGASFQLRNTGDVDLDVVAVTMPPWPGDFEAELVTGPFG